MIRAEISHRAGGRPASAGRRGVATVMVLVLLMVLVAMAVPFVYVMSQQEAASAASLQGEETRVVCRTGADHAYGSLHRGNRLLEFERWLAADAQDLETDPLAPPRDNPFADGYLEHLVDLRTDLENGIYPGLLGKDGAPLFSVEDPTGLVLGMNVEDESGKVNLNAASLGLLGNLLGSSCVVSAEPPTGSVYPSVVLDDASFLTPFDEDDNENDNIYRGGYVVISGVLHSYESRRGNVLYSVGLNPVYAAQVEEFIAGGQETNLACFASGPKGREIQPGEWATSPLPFKIALWRARAARNHSRDGVPARFNNLGEVRRIAEDVWFPEEALYAEGIDPVLWQGLERNATTFAPAGRFDGRFFYPHVVRGQHLEAYPETGRYVLVVNVDTAQAVQPEYYTNWDPRSPLPWNSFSGATKRQANLALGIGAGNLVRLTRRLPGNDPDCVIGVVLQGTRNGYMQVAVPWEFYDDYHPSHPVLLEVAERAPVNINSAPFAVLVACLKGLKLGGSTADPITIEKAEAVADAILARTRYDAANPAAYRPFEGLSDLEEFLQDLVSEKVLAGEDRSAILFQQYYPYAPQPLITAPFGFESLDVYAVESWATRYTPLGLEVAREGFREWASVGSDRETTWEWRYWEILAAEMRAPQGNILQLHRAGDEGGRTTAVVELPELHYDTECYRRGRFAASWTNRQMNLYSRAAGDDERFYDTSTVATIPLDTGGATVDTEVGDLTAGAFSFWVRPQFEPDGQTHYLFDVAEQEHSNRFSLLWWGSRQRGYRLANHNSGLVLRVKDRTLEQGYTELRYELEPEMFPRGRWTHLSLAWEGGDLSQLSLILDGDCAATDGRRVVRPVQEHTFRSLTGVWTTRTSTLQQELLDPAVVAAQGGTPVTEIFIDSADIDAFPDRGVLRIGDEAVEYDGNDGISLQNIVRGARGTTARSHPVGVKVTVFGYTTSVQEANVSNTAWNQPRFPYLPLTTGTLVGALGDRPYYRVQRAGSTSWSQYYEPTVLGPDAGFPGADGVAGVPADILPLDSYDGLPDRGILMLYGYTWRGYHPPGTPNAPDPALYFPDLDPATAGLERVLQPLKQIYVYYDSITAQGLHVAARYDEDFNEIDPSVYLHFMGQYDTQVTPQDPSDPAQVNTNNFFKEGTVAVLVSLEVSDTSGYHNKSYVQVDDEWLFYNLIFDQAPLLCYIDSDRNGTVDLMVDGVSFRSWIGGIMQNPGGTETTFGSFRRREGTGSTVHYSGSLVLPVFATTVKVGAGDVVTLIYGKNSGKELHQVRRQAYSSTAGAYLAALSSHTLREFRPEWADICKFPTGELPVELPTTWTFGGADPRTSDGAAGLTAEADFDSFEIRGWNRRLELGQNIWGGIPGAGEAIEVNSIFNLPSSGEVQVDYEIITYDGTGTSTELRPVYDRDGAYLGNQNVTVYWLTNITRDVRSNPAAHTKGTPVFVPGNLKLSGSMTATSPSIGTTNDSLEVTRINGLPSCGVARVDDELISWTDTEEIEEVLTWTDTTTGETYTYTVWHYWLHGVRRGLLGTLPAPHAPGAQLHHLESLRVAFPRYHGERPDQNSLSVVETSEPLRDYGFVRVDAPGANVLEAPEIIGYQRYDRSSGQDANGNAVTFGRIWAGQYNPMASKAIFRGCFGTDVTDAIPGDWNNDYALFFEQPVRYPDYFPSLSESQPGTFVNNVGRPDDGLPAAVSPEIAYLQGATTFRNSVFFRFRWRFRFAPHADLDLHQDAIGARLVLRFDGRGDWDDIPTNAPGGLYAFDFEPGGADTEEIDGFFEQTDELFGPDGAGVRADTVEWRIYVYFKPGAFERNEYNITPQLGGLAVDLRQISRVLRHEERR